MLEEHLAATGSKKAKEILDDFPNYIPKFKKIVPFDYKRMLVKIAEMEEKGMSKEQAEIEAFYANTRK
jgi:glutamate synthase (ferredoxin)